MGYRLVQQPNGGYALFSSIVDDFVFFNAILQEVFESCIEEYGLETGLGIAKRWVAQAKRESDGWLKCLDTRAMIHGDCRQARELGEGPLDEGPLESMALGVVHWASPPTTVDGSVQKWHLSLNERPEPFRVQVFQHNFASAISLVWVIFSEKAPTLGASLEVKEGSVVLATCTIRAYPSVVKV